ncbi:hypothetical protein BKA80DRAFT_259264 [Phyllosticta citrichinensis]
MILSEHDTKRHVRRSPWRRHSRSSHGSSPADETDYYFFESNQPINNNIIKIDNTINKNIKTVKNDKNFAGNRGSTVNLANHVYCSNSASGSSGNTNVSRPSPSSTSSHRRSRRRSLRRSISGIWHFSRRQDSGDSSNSIGSATTLQGVQG